MEDLRRRLGLQVLFDFTDILEAVEFVKAQGLSVLEVNLSNVYFYNQLKERVIREKIKDEVSKGLKILFHYIEGISFFIPESELVDLSLSLLKRTLGYLNEVGAECLTLHLGNDFTFGITGRKLLPHQIYPDFYITQMERVIKEMVNFPFSHTILCVENVGGFRYPFVLEILSRYLGGNLGLTLDIGHINRLPQEKQKIEIEFFKIHLNHIKNCHIHDNSGEWDEHNIVGEGKIDIRSYLEMLRNTESYLIVEVRPKESALESLRRLERML